MFEVEKIKTRVGYNSIRGVVYKCGENSPAVLILAGGANISYKKSYYPHLQKNLAERGVSSASFDFRGVGKNAWLLANTSLYTRLEDAQSMFRLLKNKVGTDNIYVLGVSMGAPIAIRLTQECAAKGVILISPAAYSDEAWLKNFGPEFTKAIRKEKNWEGSQDFDILEQFDGKTLVAYGKEDKVVPLEILKEYEDIVSKKEGKALVFPDVGHSFMRVYEDGSSINARSVLTQEIIDLTSE